MSVLGHPIEASMSGVQEDASNHNHHQAVPITLDTLLPEFAQNEGNLLFVTIVDELNVCLGSGDGKVTISFSAFLEVIASSAKLVKYMSIETPFVLIFLSRLCKFQGSSQTLRILTIHSRSSALESAKAVAELLGGNNVLVDLSLYFIHYEVELDVEALQMLGDALGKNRTLELVTIQYLSDICSREAMGKLVTPLNTSNNNVLKVLTIYDIADAALEQLAAMLRDNMSLKCLRFSRSEPRGGGDEKRGLRGVGCMSDALFSNSTLKQLCIVNTNIRVEEMQALVRAFMPHSTSGLQPNSSLTHLVFNDKCKIRQEGFQHLNSMLHVNTSLKFLYLGTGIFKKGNVQGIVNNVLTFFDSLKSNTSLNIYS